MAKIHVDSENGKNVHCEYEGGFYELIGLLASCTAQIAEDYSLEKGMRFDESLTKICKVIRMSILGGAVRHEDD